MNDAAIAIGDFAALMADFAPFECKVELAVAVSGGADSMALCLLADEWARRRGGRIIGLTVDHGLRAGSAAEARQVGDWLAGRNIEHHILRWRGHKPATGVQAAARAARYRLLAARCRRRGVLHLLTAHHRDDQAETVLLRLDRQSGLHGLTGIAAVRPWDGVRLLRPLLPVSRRSLEITLQARKQPWLEDPGNQNVAFARVRARRALAGLADAGFRADMLVGLARQAGALRRSEEDGLMRDAVAAVDLHAAGFAIVDIAWWRRASVAARKRLLAALLHTIGGRDYPVSADRLGEAMARLGELPAGRATTLAGCRLVLRGEGLLICREAGRLPRPLEAVPGHRLRWDRFDIAIGRSPAKQKLRVGALGSEGWSQVRSAAATVPPAPVRPTLPALWSGSRVLVVPHLGYVNPDRQLRAPSFSAIFSPPQPLVSASSGVVGSDPHTMFMSRD